MRLRRHLTLAGLCLAVIAATIAVGPSQRAWDRLSMTSAWLSLALLCGALAIGPSRVFTTGRPALNSYPRRDMAIWAGLAGLLHVYAGTVVAMTADYVAQFVKAADGWPPAAIRNQLFMWGATAGYLVGLIVLMLLALSNDRSLRWLGARRWKRLHRASYAALMLTALHGLAFQVLEARPLVLIALTSAAAILVVGLQLAARRAAINARLEGPTHPD